MVMKHYSHVNDDFIISLLDKLSIYS